MANALQRRFIELGVNEVSLVDSAANEEEFAVIKSLNAQQEETMPDNKTTVVNKDADDQPIEEATEEAVEAVEIEVPASSDAAVQKAMDKVASTVEAIAKAAGISVDSEEQAAEATATEKAKKASSDDSAIRKLFVSKLKATGMKDDDLKKATDEFDKVATKATASETKVKKDDETKPVEKATESPSAANSLLEQLTEEIEKAKRFTPKRADQLKAAIDTLAKLASELDASTEKTQLPGTSQLGESGIKEITKAIGDLGDVFKGQLGEIVETNKSLTNRVEAIEKERQPSQSVNDEGGTDAEVKKDKGLWSGVL